MDQEFLDTLTRLEDEALSTTAGYIDPSVGSIMVEFTLAIDEARDADRYDDRVDAITYRAKARAYLKAAQIVIGHLPEGRRGC